MRLELPPVARARDASRASCLFRLQLASPRPPRPAPPVCYPYDIFCLTFEPRLSPRARSGKCIPEARRSSKNPPRSPETSILIPGRDRWLDRAVTRVQLRERRYFREVLPTGRPVWFMRILNGPQVDPEEHSSSV
jgi:hypothetical protein